MTYINLDVIAMDFTLEKCNPYSTKPSLFVSSCVRLVITLYTLLPREPLV